MDFYFFNKIISQYLTFFSFLISNMANLNSYHPHEQKLFGFLNNFKSMKASWDHKCLLQGRSEWEEALEDTKSFHGIYRLKIDPQSLGQLTRYSGYLLLCYKHSKT